MVCSTYSHRQRDEPSATRKSWRAPGFGGRGVALPAVHEVAAFARCEHKAVRNAISTGQLQAFQPAHKLLVREQDARDWVESRPVRASQSAAEDAGAASSHAADDGQRREPARDPAQHQLRRRSRA